MIEELRRFLLVAQEGNLTKTAEKIFITQSALTQSIQRLEKALGTKLFVQKGKYLHLTPDGQAVVTVGNKIVQLWENAKDPKLRKNFHSQYTIGLFDNAAMRLGPFLQNNINIGPYQLELIIDTSGKLMSQLQLGVLDAAICVVNKKFSLAKDISLVKTFSEELIPVSSKKFSSPIDEIPFILYNKSSHTREQIDEVFSQKNISPKIYVESTSTTFMKELALLGSGVALLPKNHIRSELAQKTLIKQSLPLKWKREYGFYINEQSTLRETTLITDMILHLHKYKL